MDKNGNAVNGNGNGGGGISKKDLELLIEKASQTGPTQTIRIEQAPIKITTDEKPYTL
jgi:ferredoxin